MGAPSEDAERLNEGGESSYAKQKQRRNEEDGQ